MNSGDYDCCSSADDETMETLDRPFPGFDRDSIWMGGGEAAISVS